jgi:predicted phosphohydrolase
MRIVAVADTHLFEDDLEELPAGDVLVHAGDMLRFGELEELAVFSEWLATQPHPSKVVIAGNHDWCFQRQRGAAETMLGTDVHYLQDSGVELLGLRWWGSPWQPEFNHWAFNLSRGEQLREKWKLIPDAVDILVTHSPPAGIGDHSSVGQRLGCEELAVQIEKVQPRLHVFGHIHEDGGLWRRGEIVFANVTTWECERGPTVIDLDVATGQVVPVEVPARGW